MTNNSHCYLANNSNDELHPVPPPRPAEVQDHPEPESPFITGKTSYGNLLPTTYLSNHSKGAPKYSPTNVNTFGLHHSLRLAELRRIK